MIKAGVIDCLGERSQLLYNIDKLLVFIKNNNQEIESRQSSLFGALASSAALPRLNLDPTTPADDRQKLNWEKELLGLYVSAHPLAEYSLHLEERIVPLKHLQTPTGYYLEKAFQVAGVISKVKKIILK